MSYYMNNKIGIVAFLVLMLIFLFGFASQTNTVVVMDAATGTTLTISVKESPVSSSPNLQVNK